MSKSSHASDENDSECIVSKFMSYHPEISVDISTASSQNTIASNTISKPNTVCIVTTNNEDLKQLEDSKLPPYVNSSRLPTRTNKNVSTNQPSKSASPKSALFEKSVSSAMADTLDTVRLLPNSKDVTVEVMPQRSSGQIPSTSIGDSVSTSVRIDEVDDFHSHKPKLFQEQVASRPNPSIVLEKNISNNVLTVTQCVSPKLTTSTTTSVSYSDNGKSIARFSPTSAIESVVKNHLSCPDTVTARVDQRTNLSPTKVENMPSNSVKEDSAKMSPKIVQSRVEVSKKSPIIMDTSEIADKIAKKTRISLPINVDSSKNTQIICSQRAKKFAASKPKHPKILTTYIKTDLTNAKSVTYSVSNVSTSSSTPTMVDSTHTASSNRAKEAMEALNAGDNYALTNSVTISNPAASTQSIINEHLLVPTSGDNKLRNAGSESNVTKMPSNPNPSFKSDGDGSGDSDNISRNNAVRSPSSICVPTVSSSSSAPSSTSPTNSSSSSFDDAKIQKMRVRKEVQNSDSQLNAVQSTDLKEENVTKEENSSNKIDDSVECLTISSDDDEDMNDTGDSYMSNVLEEDAMSISLLSKEPLIEDDDDATENADTENVDGMWDDIDDNDAQMVTCRTVRIGSYKSQPLEPVALSRHGVRMVVSAVNDDTKIVVLKIPIRDIKKMLVNFGQPFPSIFYYVSSQCGARVRHLLKMETSFYYFDPTSKDESLKRITLLLEDSLMLEAERIKLLYSYPDRKLMVLLNSNEANELLLKSSPREVRRSIQRTIKSVPHNKVQTIMVFPPPPAKGGISINTEDYSCLAEDVFLNDVIIDFYLKYLYLNELKDKDREKTHIFSSFFYKRLTDRATPMPKNFHGSKTGDSTITAAEIRHSRVKNWTKNIDLFEKDFIIIPLNENQHWFLAIICYPGLRGPVSFETNEPIQTPSTTSNENQTMVEVEDGEKQETMTIGSTTITPVKGESNTKFMTVDEDGDGEDRDEADGADEEEHLDLDLGEDLDEYSNTSTGEVKPRLKPKREPIKQPCILIFDSLAGASRARIIATLREYLNVEYKIKHGEERDFSRNVVRGNCPRVPQQNNFTDCGLFVLQYVESFFENKITDYNLPIRMLSEWFEPDKVSSKRYEIQQLLLRLMREQDIDIAELGLPHLDLSPDDTDGSTDDYYDDVDDYDEEEDIEGYGPSEDEYDNDDEEMGEHEYHGIHYGVPDSEDDEDYESGNKMRWLDEDSYGTMHDDESVEDEECDIYKNMDDIETVDSDGRSRTQASTTHRGLKREFDERRQKRVENMDIDNVGDESDGEDVKIQERLFGNNDNVTISVASGSSIAVGDDSNALDPVTSTTTADRKHVIQELKAARPFNNRDGPKDGSGCSSSKKFKSH